MKVAYLAALCAATLLGGCQTSQTQSANPAGVSSCSEAFLKMRPLVAENEAFNRKIVRTSGRRAVRASVEADLPPEDAARRAVVIQELAALNEFTERNRCPLERPRRS